MTMIPHEQPILSIHNTTNRTTIKMLAADTNTSAMMDDSYDVDRVSTNKTSSSSEGGGTLGSSSSGNAININNQQRKYICSLCAGCRPTKRSNIEQHIWQRHAADHGGDSYLHRYRASDHKGLVARFVREVSAADGSVLAVSDDSLYGADRSQSTPMVSITSPEAEYIAAPPPMSVNVNHSTTPSVSMIGSPPALYNTGNDESHTTHNMTAVAMASYPVVQPPHHHHQTQYLPQTSYPGSSYRASYSSPTHAYITPVSAVPSSTAIHPQQPPVAMATIANASNRGAYARRSGSALGQYHDIYGSSTTPPNMNADALSSSHAPTAAGVVKSGRRSAQSGNSAGNKSAPAVIRRLLSHTAAGPTFEEIICASPIPSELTAESLTSAYNNNRPLPPPAAAVNTNTASAYGAGVPDSNTVLSALVELLERGDIAIVSKPAVNYTNSNNSLGSSDQSSPVTATNRPMKLNTQKRDLLSVLLEMPKPERPASLSGGSSSSPAHQSQYNMTQQHAFNDSAHTSGVPNHPQVPANGAVLGQGAAGSGMWRPYH